MYRIRDLPDIWASSLQDSVDMVKAKKKAKADFQLAKRSFRKVKNWVERWTDPDGELRDISGEDDSN